MTGQTTRRTKTPAQRAQEAADVARRRVDRLHTKRSDLVAQIQDIEAELRDAGRRLEYALDDPALPTQPTTSTTAPEETA